MLHSMFVELKSKRSLIYFKWLCKGKGKGHPPTGRGCSGGSGQVKAPDFTRVLGCQLYTPVAFTSEEIPGTHFQRLSLPQGTWFRREPRKKSPVTPPGIDPETVRLVAQCLNHYATRGPRWLCTSRNM